MAVVNTAGYVRVDDAEEDASRCFRENQDGPRVLARACAEAALALVTFSSDLVFDGTRAAPYVEGDATRPLNVYGRSKAKAERLVLEAHPSALVVRTSAFFGPGSRPACRRRRRRIRRGVCNCRRRGVVATRQIDGVQLMIEAAGEETIVAAARALRPMSG